MTFSGGGWPVWKGDFSPFGQELDTQYTPNNFKFTGKERDAESGLDYFGARYYASTMGRFVSPDPTFLNIRKVFNPQRWNLYSYALNNPMSNVDPDGNEVIPIVYPNYQVAYHGDHTLGLGHGGVVLVERDGTTHYFEYGRYAGPDGMVRNAGAAGGATPSVQRDASGNITPDSMNNLLKALSTASGKGGVTDALVIPTTSAEDENILTYLKARQAENGDPNRQKYSLFGGHNCGTLSCETLNHAGMTSVPPMKFGGTPYNNFMRLWFQFQNDAAYQYQPKEHVTVRIFFNDQLVH